MLTSKSVVALSLDLLQSTIRRVYPNGALLVLTTLITATGLQTPVAAQSSDNLIRVSEDSSRCWHIKGDPTLENGSIIHIWDCNGGTDRNRSFYYDASTGYIRHNINRNKCLHKQRESWNEYDTIHLWDCTAGPAENKTFDYDAPSGEIRFRENSSWCAQARYPKYDNGNPIVVGKCNSAERYAMTVRNVPTSAPRQTSAAPAGAITHQTYDRGQDAYLRIRTGSDSGAGTTAKWITVSIVFDNGEEHRQTLNKWSLGNSDNSVHTLDMKHFRRMGNANNIVFANNGSSSNGDNWQLIDACFYVGSDTGYCDLFTFNLWVSTGSTTLVKKRDQ